MINHHRVSVARIEDVLAEHKHLIRKLAGEKENSEILLINIGSSTQKY
jgi:hypothetical protein